MITNNIAIGTDIEENVRFKDKSLENDENFFKRIFTSDEISYCFSTANPEQHLCARFCAKEAVVKALSMLNISHVYYSDIEIIHNHNGVPCVKIPKCSDLTVKLSISHCKNYSTATAIIFK